MCIRDRDALAVQDPVAEDSGDPLAGGEDAGEVDRIRGAEDDQGFGARLAVAAQGGDGLRVGELLAAEAGHEASAAYFATGLQAPVGPQQLPSGRQAPFAFQDPTHHQAVALDQLMRQFLQADALRRWRFGFAIGIQGLSLIHI